MSDPTTQRPRRATMQHVAALAGVSLKTVSRVVNGEPGVSAERASRVEEAARRLGYRPHLGASALRSGRGSAAIGVLVQDLSNPFCGALLRAVETRARARGVAVIAASLDDEPERERDLVAGLVGRRCDGLILMPATSEQTYLTAEVQSGLEVVIVDRVPHGVALDSVVVDNRGGSRDAVRHLLAHGHRRIGCLVDDLAIATAHERREGYREALAAGGVAHDEGLEVDGIRSADLAEAATTRLLELADPPTALFAGRNVAAEGAVRALHRRGRQHEVALIGFDDLPMADLLQPGLSVVRQDAEAEGELAVDMLLERLDGLAVPARARVLTTELVVRGSGEVPAP